MGGKPEREGGGEAQEGAEEGERRGSLGGAPRPSAVKKAAEEACSAEVEALPKFVPLIVERMQAAGVNFVALDFDMTIVDVHTAGKWTGSSEVLAGHVRPLFRELIPSLIQGGIHVGVVTFSAQICLISQVIRQTFPKVAERIPIRGEDESWQYDGEGCVSGKQAHMASAVEELLFRERHPYFGAAPTVASSMDQAGKPSITRASSLLIDDDINNVAIALTEGVRAVWFNPADVGTTVHDLLLV